MSMFAAGVAKALSDKQEGDQRSQALGLQAAQIMGSQDLQRQQLNAQIQRWTGEDAKSHLEKFQKMIEDTGAQAAEAVKAGKDPAPLRKVISDYVTQTGPALQVWSKAAGITIPDPLAMFDARAGIAPTPLDQGNAEGAKSLAAANNGGTEAAGLTAGAQEAARLAEQAKAPAVLSAEKRAIYNTLVGRGVKPDDAFDVASGLVSIQFDPAGGQAYRLNKATGTAVPTTNIGGKLTADQANAATYADRMKSAESVLAKVEGAGLDMIAKGAAALPMVGNFLTTEDFQLFDQAQRNFINAQLRRESGAVISKDEFDNARKQYFPQPGDSKAVIEQKRQNRMDAMKGMERASGPAFKQSEVKVEETKTVDGKTYQKIGGQWFEAK